MHKTYDYTQLPDPKILMASPAGIVAFANSGEEEAGIAVIMCFMTKEFQTKWAQGKNVVPIRTDIELDPNVFSELTLHGSNTMKTSRTVFRAKYALPNIVRSEYAGSLIGYLAGSMSLDKALGELMTAQ
jgi:ABC-type glycerol-3-phosphate transport system substrate-binding protein